MSGSSQVNEQEFRQFVIDWLSDNLPREDSTAAVRRDAQAFLKIGKDWQLKLYRAGLIGITWPRKYGGREGTLIEELIVSEELAKASAPPMANGLGIAVCAPGILKFGTEEQKERFLRKILECGEIWCGGFSEPNAGSDLVSLQTKAMRDRDDYIITGQKVWSTNAHISDRCFTLARTDPNAPRHKGISCFALNMHSPGITVEPIVDITGRAEFNAIYLDNVRVPPEDLIGALNEGWYVAMTALSHERLMVVRRVDVEKAFRKLVKLIDRAATSPPIVVDQTYKERIAELSVEVDAIRSMYSRAFRALKMGSDVSQSGSVLKLLTSETLQRIYLLGMEILGVYSQVAGGTDLSVEDGSWLDGFLESRARSIGGGASEIQRNIIGERILGLPKE